MEKCGSADQTQTMMQCQKEEVFSQPQHAYNLLFRKVYEK